MKLRPTTKVITAKFPDFKPFRATAESFGDCRDELLGVLESRIVYRLSDKFTFMKSRRLPVKKKTVCKTAKYLHGFDYPAILI